MCVPVELFDNRPGVHRTQWTRPTPNSVIPNRPALLLGLATAFHVGSSGTHQAAQQWEIPQYIGARHAQWATMSAEAPHSSSDETL